MTDVHEEVRQRYAEAAVAVKNETQDAAAFASNDCCGPDCCGGGSGSKAVFGRELYGAVDHDTIPDTALLASLGCGNPTAVADLEFGDVVLDLGSGGGIDVLLSAKRVGPAGKAYGLDMTDEMLELARENQRKAGVDNVEFLKGYIESVPLPDASVDVVISNCVINLAADKSAVFQEMHRVIRSGGRIGVSDIVADDSLSPQERAERGSYVGCIAGALSFDEYARELREAGFINVSIAPTHEVAPQMHAAIVKATRP